MPGDADAYVITASALIGMGRIDEARDILKDVDKIISEFSFAFERIGDIYRKKGFHQDAALCYEKFLSLHPCAEDARVVIEKMTLLDQEDHPVNEIDVMDENIPEPELFTVTLADLYIRQGYLPEARRILEKIIRKEPQNIQAVAKLDMLKKALNSSSTVGEKIDSDRLIKVLTSWLQNINRLKMHATENKFLLNRTANLRQNFPSYKIDSLIIFNMNNIRYLSGFTGSEGVLLINSDKTILLVDGRYIAQAGVETSGLRIIKYKDKIEGIAQTIKKFKLKRVGFEATSITLGMYNQLKKTISREVLVPLNDELKLLRACKDKTEIALITKAAEISFSSIRFLIDKIKPGFTEKDAALELELEARRIGADEIAFSTIVAAGENAAFPHARPTDRKIKKGDFVVIDFGVKYKGYCSDETCTIAFGKLTDRQKSAYQIVKNAHDHALACIKANIPATNIDRCVRSIFGENMSGTLFTVQDTVWVWKFMKRRV